SKTIFGSYGWRSSVSSRIGPKTVYLGSPVVRLPNASDAQKLLIANAPDELERVLHVMETLPFIHLRRQMGNNSEYNPICNLYVSMADSKNYRIAYMWGNTMRTPGNQPGPEFVMLHIPEEHNIRQQVLVLPEYNINIALGTDYMGEDKKGFLRQAMWCADQKGMLGLHAGTKLVKVRDEKTKKLKVYAVYLFGLSATGKSTWSCHQLGLNYGDGERTEVTQDDIVFLKKDGSSHGSETGFFVKTDVDKKLQEAMYYALIDKSALYENVMIDANRCPDFLDETLCANGRAVIQKSKLRIKRGLFLRNIASKSINTPPVSDVDGIIFAFITRRNTIMPFAQELTAEQAALAYLWGESSHSYASQPAKAGESVRTVGTDPFIVGSRAVKVNRFYEIIMGLVNNYPDKVKFFQYNTGGVGEIIEEEMVGGKKVKKMIRKTIRVPIELMADIQRGDINGTNVYQSGRLGRNEIVKCGSHDLSQYDPKKFYSDEQIENYIRDLVEGRRQFTYEIAEEGLNPDIIKIAEKSFQIVKDKKTKIFIPEPPKEPEKKEEEKFSPYTWSPDDRPLKGKGWRYG
ncbi:MAG: hypothetical protein A2161_09260, partial [Candidatus Schekmanbacteria bacterium RBG_13_48_7]